ncbi:hypothetical protein PHISCL_04862 [Aspergillus sclerotialis]|uniref:Uncharacterized protein n=1 Tax=Aspergillus sclerotialis TaxID=2070753 RepID=A0A3A2ZU33_9EURO|nr:hypothetical protein PHISCL_04862 [Aspergillus sclerotialis]
MSDAPHLTGACGVGAGIPPDGQKANLRDPQTFSPVLLTTSAITLLWATAFTTGRLCINFRRLIWADCQ